jgi:hypothetical protein
MLIVQINFINHCKVRHVLFLWKVVLLGVTSNSSSLIANVVVTLFLLLFTEKTQHCVHEL